MVLSIVFHLMLLSTTLSTNHLDLNGQISKFSDETSKIWPKSLQNRRITRDTYEEREKIVSTYKIMSKTQCLLQMDSLNGAVYASKISNMNNTDRSKLQQSVFEYTENLN